MNVLHIIKHQNSIVLTACSSDIFSKYQINKEGSYKILPYLNQQGIRILLYSGDQDAMVSVVDTKQFILMIPVIQEIGFRTPWGQIITFQDFLFQEEQDIWHLKNKDKIVLKSKYYSYLTNNFYYSQSNKIYRKVDAKREFSLKKSYSFSIKLMRQFQKLRTYKYKKLNRRDNQISYLDNQSIQQR